MSVPALDQLWVYLSASPLLSLLATLLAFMAATYLNRCLGGTPFLHPVIIAIVLLIAFLKLTHTDYATYFDGAQFIHFLLGPATVALAIPLYDYRERVRRMLLPIMLGCVAGIVTAVISTVSVAMLMGASRETVLTLAPRSVTSPIAMGIAEKLGGIPSLAAGLVLLTGSLGCALGPLIFRLIKVRDPSVQGFTMGLAAHGFGTAHSFSSIGAVAGAFAGLAMGLTGLLTAFILPPLVHVFGL
ncbi:putative murein hydrolase (TIGR00659 family) [Chromohalobacter marismortui]|uniref:Putative murein hydrolase (TIGR00659 family) n=1 Tax=Chromohalobacter marismortui TaxID=42055 RepID=A0A4R7NWM5_9GAMM|nr:MULTISPECIES: LrgB family protein [Chromohalobacter]MCI0511217.1 LrgB family protein [Chromohalobacter sp.]MCI0593902.1 LrgB family protein [Chromohalobacter sp.]TDU25242.1 putative murein hydrolase (TIGR00659 family) [Chromohalobacter marismortui]